MKCSSCSITIPEMPEDASAEELKCDRCNLVKEAFDFIRQSPELGKDSMSEVDECWDDADLLQEIEFSIIENVNNTVKEIFEDILGIERVRMSYAEDIRNA